MEAADKILEKSVCLNEVKFKLQNGELMNPQIVKATSLKEQLTLERCFLFENWGVSTSDKAVSIARARVEPGVTTRSHHLEGIQEIYVIIKGTGEVAVGNLKPTKVSKGDTVAIPAGTSQKITNIGKSDLIFYCVCTPAFRQECYINEGCEQ